MDDEIRESKENVVDQPTFDPQGGTNFGARLPEKTEEQLEHEETQEILAALFDYWREADNNRKSGLNPRDSKWQENLDLYWNRYDFSNKQKWQAMETMPEVPGFVDRFAAALKEALISSPDGFYTIEDPADVDRDLAMGIKRATDVWLTTAGRNQVGQVLPFSAVFEEQMKMGAIMAAASVTTWKDDIPGGRVAVETVDPRMIWLDHTYRNLYRIRRIELDRHELASMKLMKDNNGDDIFNPSEVNRLETSLTYEKTLRDAERTGTGQTILSARKPVQLDEYIATVVGRDGNVIADRALMVVANGAYLIRGPEENPFWHGKDWLTYAPLVTAPLSVYGRSYMEDFGSVAKTFTMLTNMLIDAVHVSGLNAFAMVPSMLLNPNQAAEGISPNKLFLLEDGYKAEDFAKQLQLGNLSPQAFQVWQSIKSELREAADINEIGLGQFAPKGRTSATEIDQTQQSSSALIRSVAQTVETRYLDPTLDLIWKTGMQHARADNKMLANAVGQDLWQAMIGTRRELIKRPVTFQARGISSMIAHAQQLKTLISVLSIIGANQILAAKFFQSIDLDKLIDRILFLSGIDKTKLTLSDRERMIRSLTQPIDQAQQSATQGANGAQPSPAGNDFINGAVKSLGIGR